MPFRYVPLYCLMLWRFAGLAVIIPLFQWASELTRRARYYRCHGALRGQHWIIVDPCRSCLGVNKVTNLWRFIFPIRLKTSDTVFFASAYILSLF